MVLLGIRTPVFSIGKQSSFHLPISVIKSFFHKKEKKPVGEEEKRVTEDRKSDKEAKKERKKLERVQIRANEEEIEKENSKSKPREIVLKVSMHCEGCARKIRKSLMGFEGVEDVTTDCESSKVVVKGEKADPTKVLDRVQRKTHRQVQLISPVQKPPPPGEELKVGKDQKELPKPVEKKKEDQARVVTLVLKVEMHCEGCALKFKKRIQRIKGVESVETDLKRSEVIVKGVYKAEKLEEYVYKRTGKQAVVLKKYMEPENKQQHNLEQEVMKGSHKEEKKTNKNDEEDDNVPEMTRNEHYSYPYPYSYYYYPPAPRDDDEKRYASYPCPDAYPSQMLSVEMFSDENPNACFVM